MAPLAPAINAGRSAGIVVARIRNGIDDRPELPRIQWIDQKARTGIDHLVGFVAVRALHSSPCNHTGDAVFVGAGEVLDGIINASGAVMASETPIHIEIRKGYISGDGGMVPMALSASVRIDVVTSGVRIRKS